MGFGTIQALSWGCWNRSPTDKGDSCTSDSIKEQVQHLESNVLGLFPFSFKLFNVSVPLSMGNVRCHLYSGWHAYVVFAFFVNSVRTTGPGQCQWLQ